MCDHAARVTLGAVEGASYQGGPVVLEIGGPTGALVVYADEWFSGREIEISRPDNRPGIHREHNVIRQRPGAAAPVFAAVFPAVRAGRIVVHPLDGSPAVEVEVVPARVTEVDCRVPDLVGGN